MDLDWDRDWALLPSLEHVLVIGTGAGGGLVGGVARVVDVVQFIPVHYLYVTCNYTNIHDIVTTLY